MELWLLGGGAIVLIAITLWIVWPARTAETVGATLQDQEAPAPMTDNPQDSIPPQGDRFEDQYTSATGDLSAGGVAAAMQAEPPTIGAGPPVAPSASTPSTTTSPAGTAGVHGVPAHEPVAATQGQRWPEAQVEGERIGEASRSENFPYGIRPAHETRALARARTIGLGASALLSIGSAVGGAWVYARWQRERNKPINRLRRGARDVAARLSERIPDVSDLPPSTAPAGGAATALLLSSVVVARALRRAAPGDVRDQALDPSREMLRDALARGRVTLDRASQVPERARERSRRMSAMRSMDRPKTTIMGISLGGLAAIAGGAFVIWRLLSRGRGRQPEWYVGE